MDIFKVPLVFVCVCVCVFVTYFCGCGRDKNYTLSFQTFYAFVRSELQVQVTVQLIM